MNERTPLRLAMLVALSMTVPTAIYGAPAGQSQFPAGGTSSSQMTAAEAARLATVAADMAQRAAQLAADSRQASPANSTQSGEQNPAAINDAGSTLRWRPCGLSDDPAQGSTPGAAGGERSSQTSSSSRSGLFGAQYNTSQIQGMIPGTGIRAGESAQISDLDAAGPGSSTFKDSDVIPAADAQYPETLLTDSSYSTPASYAGCCEPVGCCPPRRTLFWVVGAEATFLNPDLNDVAPTFVVDDTTFSHTTTFSADSADVDSFYISPRVWLGVQGCKWGTGFRYWHMQAAEFEFDGFFDNNSSQSYGIEDASYFSSGRLDAYTIDWEISRLFCVHNCQMQVAGGVRHAMLEADSSVTGLAETLTDPLDDTTEAVLSGYGRSDTLTRGTGLFLGLYGRQPLFPCSCVHLFYNLRGSILWGTTETYAESYAAVAVLDPDATANAGTVNSAHTGVDDDMFIGEVQLGLEWDYCLQCVPANAFVRLAVEYQRWDGGPGFSTTGSFASAEVDSADAARVDTTASASGPQLDLLGITLGTGLTW